MTVVTVRKSIKPLFARMLMLTTLVLLLAGCGDSSSSGSTTTQDPLTRQQYGGEYSGGVATGDTQQGAAYAKWVLDQDPNRRIITDAVMRNDSNLGVKVTPTATKGDVRNLLMALTQGMATQFPNRDLQVIAFFQSGDKMAQATYNRQTQQVDVQFMQ